MTPTRVRDSVRLVHVPSPSRHVLVVGGGIVAARRAWSSYRRTGGRVLVVAPRICDDVVDLLREPGIDWENRLPLPTDLDDAWMVHVVSGDPQLDAVVHGWVRSRRRVPPARVSSA